MICCQRVICHQKLNDEMSVSSTVLSVMNYAVGQGPLFWLQSTAQTWTSGSTLISPAVSHHMESMNWDTPPTHTQAHMHLQTQFHSHTVDRWTYSR